MSTYTDVTPRRPEQPGPDLSDYELVHRAMTADVRRLARAVERIARGTEPSGQQRTAAIRDYITGIGAEIRSHHQVEDDHVWPFLVALCGPTAELADLTSEHHELDPMLDATDKLAGQLATWPADLTVAGRLAQLLAELSALLDRHVEEEERDVFPLIRRYATVRDYRRLQRRFRGNLAPRSLSFVVPWAVSHATAEERPRILADAGWPLRLVLRIFAGRFAAQQRLVFGAAEVSEVVTAQTVFVRRPAAAVFAAVSNFRSAYRWRSEVDATTQEPPGPMVLGSRLVEESSIMGRRVVTESVVDAFEPGHRWTFRHRSGPIPVAGGFTVAEVRGGTELTYVLSARLTGVWRLAAPYLRRWGRRTVAASFATLRNQLEAAEAAGQGSR